MNLEKVVFSFFMILALTLNFGFFIGQIDNPDHHNEYEFFAALELPRHVYTVDKLDEARAEAMEKEKGKTWFVAVGAAHHWGPTGLPALLRKQGFKVKRTVRRAD